MSPSLSYTEWIREEAALINADGCTGVTNAYAICCLQHDVQFFYGKDAAQAYRFYRWKVKDYWGRAAPITFEQANKHFRSCHFRESRFGYLNVIGWYRYAAMRLKKTRSAWDSHREREALGVGA